ncbi:uncharacterized protein LOC105697195, partial [Orussus abietinus]|uniref:uncharacterized protein LOC105697195 n=1 Tax=Orussus abietinus TaxID=222816 RepID=UPI000C715F0F
MSPGYYRKKERVSTYALELITKSYPQFSTVFKTFYDVVVFWFEMHQLEFVKKTVWLVSLLTTLTFVIAAETGSESDLSEISSSFECIQEGYHPDPNSCRTYYKCINWNNGGPFMKFQFECVSGRVFSKARSICVSPFEVENPKCSNAESEIDHKTRQNEDLFQQFPQRNGQVSVPDVEEISIQQYDQQEFPDNVKNQELRTAVRDGDDDHETPAKCSKEGFLRDEKDCRKFYRCVTSNIVGGLRLLRFSCGPGTVWDPEIEGCNHPWAVPRDYCMKDGFVDDLTNNVEENVNNNPEKSEEDAEDYDKHWDDDGVLDFVKNPADKWYNPDFWNASDYNGNEDNNVEETRNGRDNLDVNSDKMGVGDVSEDLKDSEKEIYGADAEKLATSFSTYPAKESIASAMGSETYLPPSSRTAADWKAPGSVIKLYVPPSNSITKITSEATTYLSTQQDLMTPGSVTKFQLSPRNLPTEMPNKSASISGKYLPPDSMSETNSIVPTNVTKLYSPSSEPTKASNEPILNSGKYLPPGSTTLSGLTTPEDIKKLYSAPTILPTNTSNKPATYLPPYSVAHEGSSTPGNIVKGNTSISNSSGNVVNESPISSFTYLPPTHVINLKKPATTQPPSTFRESTLSMQTANDSKLNDSTTFQKTLNISGYPFSATYLPPEGKSLYLENPGLLSKADNSQSETNLQQSETVGCTSEGFHPNPEDCRKFYRCVKENSGFRKVEFSCGPGTAWDQNLQTCDYIKQVSSCKQGNNDSEVNIPQEGTPSSTVAEDSSPTTVADDSPTTIADNSSSTLNDTMISSPTSLENVNTSENEEMSEVTESDISSSSASSDNGSSESSSSSTSSDDGSSESSSSSSDDGSSESSSSSGSLDPSPSYDVSSSESSSSSEGAKECVTTKPKKGIICNRPGFYPHPTRCDKFYRCVDNGKGFNVYHFNCPPGTIFDPSIDVCNYPESVYPERECSEMNESTAATAGDNEPGTDSSGTTSREDIVETTTTGDEGDEPITDAENIDTTTLGEGESVTPTIGGDTNIETTTNGDENTEATTNGAETETASTEKDSQMEQTTVTTTNMKDSTTRHPQETEGTTIEYEEIIQSTTSEGEMIQTTTVVEGATETTEATTSYGESITETTTSTDETTESVANTEEAVGTTTSKEGTTTEASFETTDQVPSTTPQVPSTMEPQATDPCPTSNLTQEQMLLVCPTGFRRHPKHCNLFYQCTSPSPTDIKVVVLSCPGDTIYDEQKVQCLPENEASQKCEGKKPGARFYRKVPADFLAQVTVTTEILCPGEGRYKHEDEDCSKTYFKCTNNTRRALEGYIYRCPTDFVFSSVSRKCEYSAHLPKCL